MHTESKKQLTQANSSTYIAGNESFVWIGDTIVVIVGLGAIPVFDRCTGMAPTCNWMLIGCFALRIPTAHDVCVMSARAYKM